MLIDTCYENAIEVLKKNSTKYGFKASPYHYNSLWGRDGAITILGSLLTDDKKLLDTSKRHLLFFKKIQSPYGQIANAVLLKGRQNSIRTNLKKMLINWHSVDSTPWWIIAVHAYYKKTQDRNFLVNMWPSLKKAIFWLQCQTFDESELITSPESADWMDGSISRKGKVLYNNCLWYKALCCYNEMARDIGESMIDVNEIKKMINLFFWPVKGSRDILREVGYAFRTEFYDEAVHSEREHYMHYISFEWYENRCDTLANSMAILFDIADKNKSEKILNYFLKKKLSTPYPIKVLNPPAWISSYIWNPKIDLYRYNIPSQMNVPFHYHNSGIWPYVGGFYVMSLLSAGKKKESKNELGKLVQANKIGKEREWEFNEWLHGKTGKPMGAALQAWSAAGFILAYKAVVEKNILF